MTYFMIYIVKHEKYKQTQIDKFILHFPVEQSHIG